MGPAPAVAATRLAVRPFLRDGQVVFVACSGGPDSVALAAAVAFEAPRAGARAGLITIDHGLQDGSAEQAARVSDLGRGLGFDPVESVRVEVGRTGGPEGAARAARYAALRALALDVSAPSVAGSRSGADSEGRGAVEVLLGHTRDDQAETVLLGLGRGSGPRSIAGMQRVDGLWVRPFLGLDRATTVAACQAQDLPVWDDPMNVEHRFVRVRLRREVLPLLEDVLHGGVAASLARTADLLRDDLDALDAWADAAYEAAAGPTPRDQSMNVVETRPDRYFDHETRRTSALTVAATSALPRAVRTRVLRRWAVDQGAGPLTGEHTATLDALVVQWRGQGPVALPGGVAVRTSSGTLEFTPHATDDAPQE